MVNTATSLGRSGLQDWLIQRATALILALYTAFLLMYVLAHPGLDYESWRALFLSHTMRYATVLALLALIAHAWIGIWTVITDYVKPLGIRLVLQFGFLLSFLACLMWSLCILWGK
jgi:succinate dehydrogenase / fumarate reductase, membrane anchor subunit